VGRFHPSKCNAIFRSNHKQPSGTMHMLSNPTPGGLLKAARACNRRVLPLVLTTLLLSACSIRGRGQLEPELPVLAPPGTLEAEPLPTMEAPTQADDAPSTPLYRLTPGDQVSIHFPDLRDMNFSGVVRPDGYITSPRFGDLPAMGWTPAQLADSISRTYAQEFRSPRATVQVTGFGPQHFYVFGEVKNPNRYTMDGPLELVGAVTRAGGFLRSAVTANIVILKVGPDGRYTFTLHNLQDLLDNPGPPVWLEPNDIVIVPKSAIAEAADFVNDYVMTFIAPVDAFLRGRYYWRLIQNNTP